MHLTQQGLSKAIRALGGELSQQQIATIESGVVERPRALPELVDALNTTTEYLLKGEGPPEVETGGRSAVTPAELATNVTGGAPTLELPRTEIVRVQPVLGRPDIPVWSAVAAGDEQGTMIMSSEPIDWISRSDRMIGVKNPFAFHVVGDSMEDRFYQGDQAVVNPAMPMRSGADCVFIREGDDGQLYGLLKRLMRVASDAWRVRQLNPRKDFDLSRRLWTKAYPIAETRHR